MVFLKLQQISQENTCVGAWNYKESIFNKVAVNQACNTPTQVFSCEICEIFKSTYFEEHLPMDASINERQQETHALLGKKNESHLVTPKNYSYLNSTQLLTQCCSVV